MLGASQIKLTAGGGVSSPHSPIDVISFTSAELEAAVRVASDRGTYVATHAFTPEAIQRAVRAGVKTIEHGNLMDEATAKLMAEKGTWLSIQPMPEGFEKIFPAGSEQRAKALEVLAGTDRAYQLAKKYHLKTAFGTDILFSPEMAKRQGSFLVGLTKWYTPAEALHMATGENGELLALSGERSPYRGKLGVVQEGALADLLLVDGDPVKDIKLIEDPAKNFLIIMKDGRIYKNTMPK
jgi:imidazolonepropionase-like amidohydrolase